MHVTSVFESNIGEIEFCRSFLLSFLRLCVIAIGVALRQPRSEGLVSFHLDAWTARH